MGLELTANHHHMEEELVVGSYELLDQDFDLTDTDLVSHVRHVLTSVSSTDEKSDDYEKLIDSVKNTHHLTIDEVAFLVTTLKALAGATRNVSCINVERHDTLLNAIFDMNMWRYTEDVMYALADLILSLASKAELVKLCLNMLVRQFVPPKNFIHSKEKQVFNCVHTTLKNITAMKPLTLMFLIDIIPQKMPKIFEEEVSIKMYVKNMLRLESGVIGEPLREIILKALVDRLMDLDVMVGCDEKNESIKGVFDMELEDDVKSEDKALAEKLDSLMVITCKHLKLCADSGRLIEVFEILLESFKITVLEVYRPKFTQFVIFYACSLDPEYCGKSFGNMLIDIFEHDKYSPHKRVNAVAYLSSYLSRQRFLESSFIIDIFNRLVDWCYEYCQNHDFRRRRKNLEDNKVFYSACQAIIYVLCFRMRAMLHHLKPRLLERIFRDPLDPLKVCLPFVVLEFLLQARSSGLFCDSGHFTFNYLLEPDLFKASDQIERLDMFFPFDPCLLRNCESFINSSFIKWSDVRPLYIVDKEDDDMTSDEDIGNDVGDGIVGNFSEDDDDDDDDDEDDDYVMGRSYDQDLDVGFENSLDKMSITPRKCTLEYNMTAYGGFQMPMGMPSKIRPSTSPESL